MNLKRLFFWAFIFSVLLGYVLLSEKKPVEKKEPTYSTKLVKVFSFSPQDMQSVEIIQENKKVILKKNSESWELVSPEPNQEVRREAITSIISAITDTINIEVITDAPEDLTQYGLSSPPTLLNIFLVGQYEFNTLIRRPENRAIAQRITLNNYIDPLTVAETGRYQILFVNFLPKLNVPVSNTKEHYILP